MAKYPKTLGRIEAVWNKLGGEEGVDRFLRGELTVSRTAPLWHEHGGVIYFSVISDGTTGEQWIERLEKKGFQVGDDARSVLRSDDFKPTNGVTTKIAVLKGMLFEDDDRIAQSIRVYASAMKLEKPNVEVACLIREKFSDKEIEAMSLWWIVVMHEPIKNSNGRPLLLCVDRYRDGRWLDAYYVKPDDGWNCDNGFAFVRVASQRLGLCSLDLCPW